MSEINSEDPVLTEQQKRKILEAWENWPDKRTAPSLKFLVAVAWGEGIDPRTKKGRKVGEFLVSQQLSPKLARDPEPQKIIELTDEHKEYIHNNCGTMKAVEMARVLFNNSALTNLHVETQTVINFLKDIDKKIVFDNPDNYTKEYKQPKTFAQTVARINRYVHSGINPEKISPSARKNVNATMSYLQIYRYLSQISTYESVDDQTLFESEFIRCVYDKSDLTEEEVDQYIIYASEVVIGKHILERINRLEAIQDDTLEGDRRAAMSLIEAIKTLRNDYNQCVKRQNDLLDSLKGERKERLTELRKNTPSILNLISLWQEEETRKQMLALAEKERTIVKNALNEIKSMDDLQARVVGLTEEEALYG